MDGGVMREVDDDDGVNEMSRIDIQRCCITTDYLIIARGNQNHVSAWVRRILRRSLR